MKLSDKIIHLRKSKGWSQEALAEKLNVSRQAISRWEGATAQPDAANIVQLSKLFGVTTDYLLNDAYERDNDPGGFCFDQFNLSRAASISIMETYDG